nr:MAG TPA: hypothetical protein [Caudoviricetes sp.]
MTSKQKARPRYQHGRACKGMMSLNPHHPEG